MVQSNNEIIDDIIKMSSQKRKTMVNWFSRQNVELQAIVFENQRNEFFRVSNIYKNLEKNIISLISFYFAIKDLYEKQMTLKSKNKSIDLKNIERISEIELLSIKKVTKKEKYDFLLDRISKVEELYANGKSTREISMYIKKVYRKDISHQYIYIFMKQNIFTKDQND